MNSLEHFHLSRPPRSGAPGAPPLSYSIVHDVHGESYTPRQLAEYDMGIPPPIPHPLSPL